MAAPPLFPFPAVPASIPAAPPRPTFVPQAYPYYASVGSVMAGFFLVGFFFLYHK